MIRRWRHQCCRCWLGRIKSPPSAKRHSLRHKQNWRKFVCFFSLRISFPRIWRLFKMHEHSSAPSNLRNWFDTYLQIIYTYTRVKLNSNFESHVHWCQARSRARAFSYFTPNWLYKSLRISRSASSLSLSFCGALNIWYSKCECWCLREMEIGELHYKCDRHRCNVDKKERAKQHKKTMYFERRKKVGVFFLVNAKFRLSSLCEQIDEYHLRTENVKCRIDSAGRRTE